MAAHAACANERPQGPGDAPLAADHLADVLVGDVQPEDDGTVALGALDPYLVGPVDEVPRQLGEHSLHVRPP